MQLEGPITKAHVILIKYNDAQQLALQWLNSEDTNICVTRVTIALSGRAKTIFSKISTYCELSGTN